MEIQIVVRGVDSEAGALRRFAEERLETAVARFEEHILQATVRLEDVTGPVKHQTDDKHCNLDVKLRTGEIVIKEHGDEFHATINTALDRLKAALSREIGKAKRGIGEG